MNLDSTIYRMAFREADSLGVAQLLVAKKRGDLEHTMLLKQVNASGKQTGADLERELSRMARQSDELVGRLVDRYA
jgi:hypothetical protein